MRRSRVLPWCSQLRRLGVKRCGECKLRANRIESASWPIRPSSSPRRRDDVIPAKAGRRHSREGGNPATLERNDTGSPPSRGRQSTSMSTSPPLARIVLGLTGGIAAYKCAELTRLFVKAGVAVDVVMTSAACRFITPITLQARSGRPVRTDVWEAGADNG